jgi:NAD(P)-dependent dehydrogenase (short-subunit alcohol dehydrogenase family)
VNGSIESRLPGAVLVTGGGSGIGRATALSCSRRGAPVAILDIDLEAAESTAQEVARTGSAPVAAIACDARQEASVAAAVNEATERVGPLRGLLASAGIDRGGLVHEMPLEAWNEVIATNLTGTFLVCKHVLAAMLAHGEGGSLVCVSSPVAELAVRGGASAYCATKGGVSSLTRTLALDYAEHGIRVNAIVPGATETPLMWEGVAAEDLPDMRATVAAQIALGRVAEPLDIAEGVIWLLSDASAYATGSHLAVDGGIGATAHIAT